MLRSGRIPHNDAEGAAINKLLARRQDENATLTRRDPGETGPIVVTIGDDIWHVHETGRTVKQRRAV